ncbi:hypothetical protein SEA_RENNA12_64 [Arthrobacter phage Renna12]|nr:hypothetical protein SEA_RENNA12_64 [Arthrobacter phage Renna12]
MGKRERRKAALAEAVVKFMAKRGKDVVVVDSVDDPAGIAVFGSDGSRLTEDDAQAIRYFARGYRVFGGPS